jgi:hypothetical protein
MAIDKGIEKQLRPAAPVTKGGPLRIVPQGLELFLDVARDCELFEGELRLSAAEKSAAEDGKPLDFEINSDQGKIDAAQDKKVNWLLVDWGENRVVAGLEVKAAIEAGSQTPVKARVKVSQNGVWVPLTPADTLAVGPVQFISSVVTSKLMIEFVKPLETSGPDKKPVEIPGAWQPAPVPVKERPQVYFSTAPCDVNLAVGDADPFFSFQGVLPKGNGVPVEGFKEAVNNFLNNSGSRKIPLMLTAAIPGWIAPPSVTNAAMVAVLDKWEGGDIEENGRMALPWQGEAVARAAIGGGARVKAVQLQLRVDLVHERLLAAPSSIESSQAQLIGVRYAAAQGFKALPDNIALNGIDLYLRPAQLPAKAELAIYPDDMGQPSRRPYPDASVDIDLQEDSKKLLQARWLVCQFSQPLSLATKPWWAVLTVDSGELHWFAGTRRPEAVLGAVYRIGRGPWLNQADPRWNLARLRVDEPKPSGLKLFLRRGSAEISLELDARRQIEVSNNTLIHLNEKGVVEQENLELVVRSDTAGSITVANPYIKFIPNRSEQRNDDIV